MADQCPGLPDVIVKPSAVCPGQYACQDTSTNPATTVCKGMQYLVAEHYLDKGFIRSGVSGAYVPAVTVCTNPNPVLLSDYASRPDYRFVEIPTAQVPTL